MQLQHGGDRDPDEIIAIEAEHAAAALEHTDDVISVILEVNDFTHGVLIGKHSFRNRHAQNYDAGAMGDVSIREKPAITHIRGVNIDVIGLNAIYLHVSSMNVLVTDVRIGILRKVEKQNAGNHVHILGLLTHRLGIV